MPILYSFRRCPYAMRARMALLSANITVEHREIIFRDKPPSMLKASPKGTVPILITDQQEVFEESWDIMQWALGQRDPDNLLGKNAEYLDQTYPLVARLDGEFKAALDLYKYADRHPQPAEYYRQQGLAFLEELEIKLNLQKFLLADQMSIADIAIMPFVRQWAHVDRAWFEQSGLTNLLLWLDKLIGSILFQSSMEKYPLWVFR